MMALAAIYFSNGFSVHGCGGRATGEGFYRYGASKRPNRVAQMLLWQDLDQDAVAPYRFDAEQRRNSELSALSYAPLTRPLMPWPTSQTPIRRWLIWRRAGNGNGAGDRRPASPCGRSRSRECRRAIELLAERCGSLCRAMNCCVVRRPANRSTGMPRRAEIHQPQVWRMAG